VTGVHRLQHVECFAGTTLTDDDAIRAHTKGVDDEVMDRDAVLAVEVGWPRLHPADVLLVELKLGGVFDGDDALRGRDER
jgi:hypothetical protein